MTTKIRTLLITCLMLISCVSASFGQTHVSDTCRVFVIDMTGKKAALLEGASTRELGTFDTIAAEEKLTTRSFRLPHTSLFVIGSVWYTDESLASEKGADSISLQLTVSFRRKRDILGSLIYADAEVPLNGFDVGRVMTMVKRGRRTQMVVMECRKHILR